MWRAWLFGLLLVVELLWLWLERALPLYVVVPLSLGSAYVYAAWVRDLIHQDRCPYCRAARAAVELAHPGWRVWTVLGHSHRASGPDGEVIAVFYQEPRTVTEPPPYLLVSVGHADHSCEVLPEHPDSPYRLSGRK